MEKEDLSFSSRKASGSMAAFGRFSIRNITRINQTTPKEIVAQSRNNEAADVILLEGVTPMLRARYAIVFCLVCALLLTSVPVAWADSTYQLQAGKTVTIINPTEKTLSVEATLPTGGKLDYVFYKEDDQYDAANGSGQKDRKSTFRVPSTGRLVLTNRGTQAIDLKATGDLGLSPSAQPALTSTAIKPGASISIINDNPGRYRVDITLGFKGKLRRRFLGMCAVHRPR